MVENEFRRENIAGGKKKEKHCREKPVLAQRKSVAEIMMSHNVRGKMWEGE